MGWFLFLCFLILISVSVSHSMAPITFRIKYKFPTKRSCLVWPLPFPLQLHLLPFCPSTTLLLSLKGLPLFLRTHQSFFPDSVPLISYPSAWNTSLQALLSTSCFWFSRWPAHLKQPLCSIILCRSTLLLFSTEFIIIYNIYDLFLHLFVYCLFSLLECRSWSPCYPQHLGQYLAYNRPSTNTYSINTTLDATF